MFYMQTVYLELAASQQRIKELRTRDERERREDDLVQIRRGHEDASQDTGSYKSVFPNAVWRMEHWRGAGW